jgi:hypothetical protein
MHAGRISHGLANLGQPQFNSSNSLSPQWQSMAMHKTSMAKPRGGILHNQPLPSLFQARASQFALIFLSKIKYHLLPPAQEIKSGENLPDFGGCKTHLAYITKIFTRQVKTILRKNLPSH